MSRKYIIPVIVAILGIACFLVLMTVLPRRASYEDSGALADSQIQGASSCETAGISAESTHFVRRSEGKKRWEFKADKVISTDDNNRVKLEGIKEGVFYDEDRAWMYFSAEGAEVNMKTDSLNLESVVFHSASGDSLSAYTLTWNKNCDKVVLEGNVLIKQGEDAVLKCLRAEYAPGDNILEAVGETIMEIEIGDD